MKHDHMIELMSEIMTKIMDTHKEGQKEYAMDTDNVFANFERIAEQAGFNREMILWVYLMKHIDGIASYLKGHRSQREEVQGRLTDAMVYLCILWGMIENPKYPGKSKYYVNRQEKK